MGVDSSALLVAVLNSHCISLFVVLSLARVVSGLLSSWTAVALECLVGAWWVLGGWLWPEGQLVI
jgi:hypothetical protein